MLSQYFIFKTSLKKFEDDLNKTIQDLKDKKVILYGAGEGFLELLKKYPFKKLNVLAIADRKFDRKTNWMGFSAICPKDIEKEDYDFILVTNEYNTNIIKDLTQNLNIDKNKIKTVFCYDIEEELDSISYLEKFNFKERLKKLKKHLKNKKIMLYGAGVFSQTILNYYDLEGFNIIGISDRKYSSSDAPDKFFNYKTYAPEDIIKANPDYVLVMNKFFIDIIDTLDRSLKGTKIKIKPIVKKPFGVILKEIWS